jgi:hypothetical protein
MRVALIEENRRLRFWKTIGGKQKKKRNKLTRLDWDDVNASYRSTIIKGRLDCDINTTKTLYTTTTEETKHNRSFHPPTTPFQSSKTSKVI